MYLDINIDTLFMSITEKSNRNRVEVLNLVCKYQSNWYDSIWFGLIIVFTLDGSTFMFLEGFDSSVQF